MRVLSFVTLMSLVPLALSACDYDEGVQVILPGSNTWHLTGNKLGNAWEVTVKDPPNAYMSFGPYTSKTSSRDSKVDFLLSIDNNNNDNLQILTLDVYDDETKTDIATMNIYRTDFRAAGAPQNFTLPFTNSRCSQSLEFRVYYHCCAEVIHYQSVVRNLDGGLLAPFWNLQAHFEVVSVSPAVGGSYIVPMGNVWYLFHRVSGATPAYCPLPQFWIVVKTSTDMGKTWSEPVTIASPVLNTPSECALVDGVPFYDKETNIWHYLSQCLARTGGWNMCHYYRAGADPRGPFTTNPKNPVVKGGELWSQICSGNGKHCPVTTMDEGTPDIAKKENGWFYVTFHGFDSKTATGYRGVAKTFDFYNWRWVDFDLPDDAIFSPRDCQSWNISWSPKTGCIGSGEGSILMTGDYYYQLIEAADLTLNCVTAPGEQNWVLGLVRSPSLGPSGTWQRFARDPVIVPAVKNGCGLQYHRLFKDNSGNVFLLYNIFDFATGKSSMKISIMKPGYQSLPIQAIP